MLSPEAVLAGITDREAERYAKARQGGELPVLAIRRIDLTKCIKMLFGLETILRAVARGQGMEDFIYAMTLAALEEPDSTDALMGYSEVIDKSLYEPMEEVVNDI